MCQCWPLMQKHSAAEVLPVIPLGKVGGHGGGRSRKRNLRKIGERCLRGQSILLFLMLWMWKYKADACGRLAKIRGDTPWPFFSMHKADTQRSGLPLPGLGLSLKWTVSNQRTRDDLPFP